MEEYKYTYILMGVGFGLIWLAFWLFNKRFRREMLVMSVVFAILAPISNILFIKDWWHPLTVDGTSVGFIDSVFVGFVIGGVTGVLYEWFQKVLLRKPKKSISNGEHLLFAFFFFFALAIFFGGFYIFSLNSFITSTLALFIPTLVIWWRRKDLIKDSLITGILLVVSAMLVYNFLEIFTPGWVKAFWKWQNTPEFVLIGLPIDDVIHYFFLGMFGGPLYEYWEGRRLRRK